MVLAGAVMVLRVAPKVTELPQTGYGRMLLLKLVFVGLLLVRRPAGPDVHRTPSRQGRRPACGPCCWPSGVELVLAVVILTSTSVLVGRVPPSERTPTNAVSTLKGRR